MDFNLTLIGQSLAMLLFVWFCMKYVWPLIMGAIEQRQTEIANGSGRGGDRARARSARRRSRSTSSSRRRATKRAASSIKRTRVRSSIVEQGKADGEAARKGQLEAARTEIEVEINRAREELRGQVAKIAVAGAAKVLGREIDANAHRDLLGKLASEL